MVSRHTKRMIERAKARRARARLEKSKEKFSRRHFMGWALGGAASVALGTIAGLSGRRERQIREQASKPASKKGERAETKAIEPKRPAARKQAPAGFPKPSANMSVLLPRDSPCLSAGFIDAELRNRKSPAAGFGSAFVKWGRFYGVRPGVALAFFRKESNWGTRGVAVQTKAIGNIRFTPSSGSGVKYSNYKGFRKYASWEDGIRDWCWLISSKSYAGGGRTSLEQIISKYAPKEDLNDPVGYRKLAVSYLGELYKKASE